jgi:CheY-like chemotaxis protein
MRILLVEDHDDTVRVLTRILARTGILDVARTLAAARVLCGQHTYDVLVCDIALPDGSGWDLMPEFARAGGGCAWTRGIALTGYGTRDDVERSRLAGFDLHLTKPVTAEKLLEAIRTVRAAQAAQPPSA